MRKLTRSHSTCTVGGNGGRDRGGPARSEEHTSELQSRSDLVCRLLLEKKKKAHRTDGRVLRDHEKQQLAVTAQKVRAPERGEADRTVEVLRRSQPNGVR